MDLSPTEENYLKAILRLSAFQDKSVNTNAIASHLQTSAASVTDMLKRLSGKKLITYLRYNGARLTEPGYKTATYLVRKHRLWKVFLVQTLGISWDEVSDIAEELEHIHSDLLIDRLDSHLGFPKFDPHGDPIPNAQGKYTLRSQSALTDLQPGKSGLILGVKETDPSFLAHLTEKGIAIGKTITALSFHAYDQSMKLKMDDIEFNLSGNVARNILVKIT
jgi:DtxR family Mn-dependent transcriptional regulator